MRLIYNASLFTIAPVYYLPVLVRRSVARVYAIKRLRAIDVLAGEDGNGRDAGERHGVRDCHSHVRPMRQELRSHAAVCPVSQARDCTDEGAVLVRTGSVRCLHP